MAKPKTTGGLVYSTEHGSMCPACRQALTACICKKTQAPAGDGIVRVSRETKGRKGKGVTLIKGVPLAPLELAKLTTQLKARCGSGGTIKDGTIEIQGDHCDTVLTQLAALGWQVKRAGG